VLLLARFFRIASSMPARPADQPEPSPIRLQKYLASAGLGSRRHCEEYILTGRVSIDGKQVFDLGTKVIPGRQKVLVDGELLKLQAKRYYLLNKPTGCVCTNQDPAGRTLAVDLVPNDGTRLFTVGRLDESSEGLLLVTNDGELANRLAHPRHQVVRTYRVQVAGIVNRGSLMAMKKGIHFAEGRFGVREARKTKTRGRSSFLELTLTQGRNREIRRLLAKLGHKVIHLERISFGPLNLGRVPRGSHRLLRPPELKALRALLDPEDGRPARKRASGGKPATGPARKKHASNKAASTKRVSTKRAGTQRAGTKRAGTKRPATKGKQSKRR
jgi:23S rRNA pseudouridine2605 synthase